MDEPEETEPNAPRTATSPPGAPDLSMLVPRIEVPASVLAGLGLKFKPLSARLAADLSRILVPSPAELGLPSDAAELIRDDVFGTAMRSWTRHMAEQASGFAQAAERMRRRLPPNWPTEGPVFGNLLDLAERSGLPLVWVPRPEVIERLLEADDVDQALLEAAPLILDDCQEVVNECTAAPLQFAAATLLEGIETAQASRWRAAQATAAVVYEFLWKASFDGLDLNYVQNVYQHLAEDPRTATVREIRGAFLMIAGRAAWTRFWVDRGDPIPTVFSRNATVHALTDIQYTRRNSLVGLMRASALLRETQELSSSTTEAA